VGKPEFGNKVTCTACSVRFFDLRRAPAICPICHAEQPKPKPRPLPVVRSGATRWQGRQPPTVPIAAVADVAPAEADALEEVDEVEVDDDDVVEADLPDDEDDTPKVKHDD
jgi:hypothetical protein